MEIYKGPIPLDKGSTSQARGHEQRSQGQCSAQRIGEVTGNVPQTDPSIRSQHCDQIKVLMQSPYECNTTQPQGAQMLNLTVVII